MVELADYRVAANINKPRAVIAGNAQIARFCCPVRHAIKAPRTEYLLGDQGGIKRGSLQEDPLVHFCNVTLLAACQQLCQT